MKRLAYAIIGVIILALAGIIPAYLALGQEGGQQAAVTITARPASGSPGGGGGGAPAEIPACPAGEVATGNRVSGNTGLVFQGFVIKSFDKKLSLFLDQGITVLTPDGKCPRCIGLHEMTAPPSLPEGAHLIGAGYDAIPDLTAFTPPATTIYSYDPDDIPEGINEEGLVIALRDPATGEWMKLDCLIDSEAHTITAKIGRFNDIAVLGYEPEAPTTAPTTAPTSPATSAPEPTPMPPATPAMPSEPTPTEPFNWWPTGGVIIAAAVGAAIYLYRGRLSPLYQRSVNQSRRWWSKLRRAKRP